MIDVTSGTTVPLSFTLTGLVLTGAVFSTEIKAVKGVRVIPDDQHDASGDVVEISLTADDWEAIGYGTAKEVVIAITQSGVTFYRRGHVLTIRPPHPDK